MKEPLDRFDCVDPNGVPFSEPRDTVSREWATRTIRQLEAELAAERERRIVYSPDAKAMSDRVEALKADVANLRAALEFYADTRNYKPEIVRRIRAFAGIARAVLKETSDGAD